MAAEPSDLLSPQQRLAISRKALVSRLNEGRSPSDEEEEPVQPPRLGNDASSEFAWSTVARNMVSRWWRRHPANAVGQIARPLLNRYARQEPAKLIAVAAATGALLVLVKPWRLLSVTAVLAAALKTSDMADLVNTLMQNNTTPRKDPYEQ